VTGISFVADASHVVHGTIDGEAILIHLGTGTYYSLDGVGAEIWGVLAAGAHPDALIAAGLERYEGDPAEVERGLRSLVEELAREGLVIEGEPQPVTPAPGLPSGRVPFSTPVLRIYTDMQDFMLVDPLFIDPSPETEEVARGSHAQPG
jgi:Coenzyme PQQ synthesis protein D (PqqD)